MQNAQRVRIRKFLNGGYNKRIKKLTNGMGFLILLYLKKLLFKLVYPVISAKIVRFCFEVSSIGLLDIPEAVVHFKFFS